MRLFDLNIETVLEHWDVEHGLREIIANALDECTLSGTAPINIAKDDRGCWHIRDYGRGIRIEHFTLNENLEKIGADGVIGKFGVGLKDALAALDRHHAKVSIWSQHGVFTLTKAAKHDFDGITTLHISHEPGDQTIRGTDIVLTGVPDTAIEKAKEMFLCFREHRVLDTTSFGEVLTALPAGAEVFINGVWANAEPTFLFSYNVTSLTDSMRKALNRERVNVGRSVYADRLRQILKFSNAADVLQSLASTYARRDEGELPEELSWIDVAHKALNELAKSQKVVVISQSEIKDHPEHVEDIKRDGRQIVLLTDREKQRADQQAEQGKAPFHTLRTWIQSVNDSFQYRFVDENHFTENEGKIWRKADQILGLVGLRPNAIPRILVSETMCTSEDGTNGAWDSKLRAIIVKRTQLRSLQAFAGTLLHEVAHAVTGTVDCTRYFEHVLTDYLGLVSASALSGVTTPVGPAVPPDKGSPTPPMPEPPVAIDGIAFVPVESSNVAAVAYDDKTHTLYVALKRGLRYFYQAVPQTVYTELLNAQSKGKYLNKEIIGRYKYGNI
ncbi:MAG: KTSC domain-containing protein [Kiritimatiellae bacterium]|nr:KTSC domain-containing protein [Kiritimatiellia bacterium]